MFVFGCDGCSRREQGLAVDGRFTPPPMWIVVKGPIDGHAYFACGQECLMRTQAAANRRSHKHLPELVKALCDNCGKARAAERYSDDPWVWTRPEGWFMRREPFTPASIVVCSQACATALVRRRADAGHPFPGSDLCVDEQSPSGAAMSGRAPPDVENPIAGTDADKPAHRHSRIVV